MCVVAVARWWRFVAWLVFGHMVEKHAVELAYDVLLPRGKAGAVELFPREHVARCDAVGRAEAAATVVVQIEKDGPHGPGVRRQGRHVKLGRAFAGCAGNGLKVLGLGASIGQPAVEFELGLGVAGEGFAQALVKTSMAFMSAMSWRTIHWRLGSV